MFLVISCAGQRKYLLDPLHAALYWQATYEYTQHVNPGHGIVFSQSTACKLCSCALSLRQTRSKAATTGACVLVQMSVVAQPAIVAAA